MLQNNLHLIKTQQKNLDSRLKIEARANLKAKSPHQLPKVKLWKEKVVKRKAHRNKKVLVILSKLKVVKVVVKSQKNLRVSSKSSI